MKIGKCIVLCVSVAAAVAVPAASLDEKAAEGRLSVRDFGAKGDGTTDDTAAIQAGIDYLAARGGVYDPDSRFRGSITYLQGYPGNGECFFPVEGGTNITLRPLGAK